MVTLYVGGRPAGTLADAERLIPELIARNQRVELRDEAGNPLGTFSPHRPPAPGSHSSRGSRTSPGRNSTAGSPNPG